MNNVDTRQFSYTENRSIEDEILLLNNIVVEHLKKKNTHIRSMFIDFTLYTYR